MSNEKEETRLYNELKSNYNFISSFLTCDFSLSNINAIKKVYKNDSVKILTCFFHLVKAWWLKLTSKEQKANPMFSCLPQANYPCVTFLTPLIS